MKPSTYVIALILLVGPYAIARVGAQAVAASSTSSSTEIRPSRVRMSWSVKKSLMGKTVSGDAGESVGTVEDLIVSADGNVSFVIIRSSGVRRHDVAIPFSQVRDQAGKLVIPGATKDTIRSLPNFDYS